VDWHIADNNFSILEFIVLLHLAEVAVTSALMEKAISLIIILTRKDSSLLGSCTWSAVSEDTLLMISHQMLSMD